MALGAVKNEIGAHLEQLSPQFSGEGFGKGPPCNWHSPAWPGSGSDSGESNRRVGPSADETQSGFEFNRRFWRQARNRRVS